jgi:methyl-accepting chemotaxis protein
MKSLRIAQTIYLLLGVALLAGGVATTYLMVRCSGISDGYTAIIHGEIREAQQVRVVQVNFKKQVQAWKDILLRGKDDEALKKYTNEFHWLAGTVNQDTADLANRARDEQVRTGLTSFREQHDLLDRQYEAALTNYASDRDFAQADAALKGKDRPPTNTLDQVTDRLVSLADLIPAEQAARLHREQTVLIAVLVFVWLALAAWSVGFARSLGLRLHRCVEFVRVIAGGDLTAAPPESGSRDEVGELIAATNEMREQLQEMVSAIQGVATLLSSNAEAVSTTSNQIAKAVSEQRGHASQVAAAMEEMVTSAHEVTRHCGEAADLASRSGKAAAGSCETMASVADEVRALSNEAQHNARTVQELGERSREINQIVTLIEEIAGQTNLLALNAAIESARAGEHGRGFAVVAGEVRRLAERTSAATKEIAGAVTSIQQGTADAVKSIEKSSGRVETSVASAAAATESLGVLGSSAAEVQRRIDQIAQATEEQSRASGLLGQSMSEIAASIMASSDGAEEGARTAAELAKMVHALEKQIGFFKTNGEGHGTRVKQPRRVAPRREATISQRETLSPAVP